ncbi:hypothetical protein C8R45DRAFT_1111392 [Mycena sanguinolenta]|nr:hypothetical protein C8R45DRAFT_1111392 [Mycena sanguinolenta]
MKWSKGNTDLHAPIGDHIKLIVGFCQLPEANLLPPNFDLHRYIPHVNRGVTHFHASFWPLPRKVSTNMTDLELEEVEKNAPQTLYNYASKHREILFGREGEATRVQRQPECKGWCYFRSCAPGGTDADSLEDFKTLVIDPSRMVHLLSRVLERVTTPEDKRIGAYLSIEERSAN